MSKRSKPSRGARQHPTRFVGVKDAEADPRGSIVLETDRTDAYLICVRGGRKGGEFPLGEDPAVIGRDPAAAVAIDDEAASRRHAMVVKDGGRFYLRDLGSTNGTYLDGVLHGEERVLADGDSFTIGESEFVFRDRSPEDARITQGLSGPVGDTAPEERRQAPRLPSRVHFSCGRAEGNGVLADISRTGLRVSAPAAQLRPRNVIRLLLSRGRKRAPLTARVRITRVTDEDFAGEFLEIDEQLRELLDRSGDKKG